MLKVYVNDRNEIHAVNSTDDESLKELKITDKTFDGWTEAKLCCYCVTADEVGRVTSYWPYVSTLIIEQLDRLNKIDNATDESLTDTQMAMCDNYEDFMDYTAVTDEALATGNTQITDLEMAVCDLYEIIMG